MKTEPEVFSFDDLLKAPKKTTAWEGVRNYQARNFMRDDFKVGDFVFVYHSNAGEETGIAGVAEVTAAAYPDQSALDPRSPYFDEKSAKMAASRWVLVDVRAVKKFRSPITLSHLKAQSILANMAVVQRGQRLSVQPVTPGEWVAVENLAKQMEV
jgi:predicted RNA-binding protein with PUA-like domain